jgi:ferredoxin
VPQLFYFDHLCQRCYRCIEACPNKATSKSPEGAIRPAANASKYASPKPGLSAAR